MDIKGGESWNGGGCGREKEGGLIVCLAQEVN